jgi:MFS transporter, DHA1 family, chloramphenicol resistance protein
MSTTTTDPAAGAAAADHERGAYSFWAIVVTLGMTAFLGTLNNMSLNAFLPFIAADIGQTVPVLGQITTVVLALGAITALVVGPLADRYGMRRFLLIGSVTVIMTAAATSVVSSFGTLFAARLISGFSGGILLGLSLSCAATLFEGQLRRKAMSAVLGGASLAPVIGVPLLTFVASLSTWRIAFIVFALFSVAVTALVRLVLPRSAGPHVENEPFHLHSYLNAYRPLFRDRNMLALYIAMFTRTACWLGYFIYLGAYLNIVLAADTRTIGWGYMVAGAGFFAGTFIAGGWLNNVGLRPLLAICLGVMASLMVIQLSSPVGIAWAFTLMAAISFVAAVSTVCLQTLLQNETPAGRATTGSLGTMMFGLGAAAGGAFGGVLIAVGGFPALGIGLPSLLVVSIFLVWKPRGQGSATPHPGTFPTPT